MARNVQPRKSRQCSLWLFTLVVCAVYCAVFTVIEFAGVPLSGAYSYAATAFQFGVVAFCTCGVLALLCSSRLLFAIFFPPLMLASSVMSYFVLSIGTRLTATGLEVALVNDASMWFTMISPGLVAVVLVALTFGILAAIYRWKFVVANTRRSSFLFIGGLLVICCPLWLVPRIQQPVAGRMPYAIYFATRDYLATRSAVSEVRDTYDKAVVSRPEDAPDVVFVLGESLRSDHTPWSGYERNTMPAMSADTAVIPFTDVYSDYIHTFVSVPHILTEPVEGDPDAAYDRQSFITLFNKAGYRSAWFANQDLARSYAYFAHECDTVVYANADRSLYSYELWPDTDLIAPFEDWLTRAQAPSFALLHTIGSHWWYKSHYTAQEAVFLPDIESKDVGGIPHQNLVNAYDNTIIATDRFLARLIDGLRDRNAVLLYISDHGESLGENGVYFHAADSEPLHRPACFVWYSKEYALRHPQTVHALKCTAAREMKTTDIFNLVMVLSELQYRKQ